MRLTFLGAAKTVTGSCYWLEANGKNILIDCGLFQGHEKEDELNFSDFPFEPMAIDYILLTHAHIDHSGRIPKLCKEGFNGQIICTKATAELCAIMLPDSGYIQESEVEWKNRKRARAGKELLKPLYTYEEAVKSLQLFKPVAYYEEVQLFGNIRVRFLDAGHILGSSILELWVNEKGNETKVVFSGDIGNSNMPILRDPDRIDGADYLIMESTYGDREHRDNQNRIEKFMDILIQTTMKGGNVVIPSFAVGRTQEIIYELYKYKEKYDQQLGFLKHVPVYVDSPLAISATEVFRKNLDCYDEEAREYIRNGDNPLDFDGLRFSKTPEQSKQLNEMDIPMVIISASGMCEAGRVKHHLKHNLWREECTVLFVGYQAPGTLGRMILDGAEKVRIMGEEISIQARIESIDGFSGHADQSGLLRWAEKIGKKPKKTFIVHGEGKAQQQFAKLLKKNFQMETVIPEHGDHYELTPNTAVEKVPYKKLKDQFARLQLLAQLDILQQQLDFLLTKDQVELLNQKQDEDIAVLQEQIQEMQKALEHFRKLLHQS